jgi:hypothetical protein
MRWRCRDSLLDLGLGRRPSRLEWHSARPSRFRELWWPLRRLPCLLDVCMVDVCGWQQLGGRLYPTNADVAGFLHSYVAFMQNLVLYLYHGIDAQVCLKPLI